MSAVKKGEDDNNDQKFSIKKLWGESHGYLFRFFLFDLLWRFIVLLVVSLIFGFILIGSICIGLPVLIILIIILIAIRNIVSRMIYFQGENPWQALEYSVSLLFKRFGKFVLARLYSLIPGCVISFVMMLVAISFGIAMFIPLVAALLEPEALRISILTVVLIGILSNLILSGLSSPFLVFTNTYWTKVIRLIASDYGFKECEERVEEAEVV